jgi:uncharacterized protein YqfA (UPF0365 family)
MSAKVQEMKAKVVEAEADVPLALAEALRSGRLGYMDYLNVENKKADTKMRDNLGNINMEVSAKVLERETN